jgi:hypothetical protein
VKFPREIQFHEGIRSLVYRPLGLIKVRVFQDRKEATQWVGVSIELVVAKNPDANSFDRSN